jgi:pre-mRNA-processing factor 6
MAAANKESDKNMKSKVLRRSLEHIPNSEKLWKELIELEGEGEAKVLLHRAVECVPQSLELWLALAKLESYEAARLVLNRARQALPTEPSIWVHAAKLEESQGREQESVDKVKNNKKNKKLIYLKCVRSLKEVSVSYRNMESKSKEMNG